MNRRGFFRRLGLAVAAVTSGISLLPASRDRFNRYRTLPAAVPTRGFPNAFLKPGFVYAPYVPLIQSGTICSDPNFIRRYAETTINDKFYSKITICA